MATTSAAKNWIASASSAGLTLGCFHLRKTTRKNWTRFALLGSRASDAALEHRRNSLMMAQLAGADRMKAGKAAGRNHNEAAKQYGKAQEDFTKAKDAARNAGDTKNADKYGKQADDAGTKAYHARHLQFLHVLNGIAVRHDEKRTVQKAAEVRDASPAYNDPRNKL